MRKLFTFLLCQKAPVLKTLFILLCLCGSVQLFSQAGFKKCYADRDGDGFGDPNDYILIDITLGADCGGINPNRVSNGDDCDDADRNAFPGQVWYKDIDDDGISTGETITQCLRPFGYKTLGELKSFGPICNFSRDALHIIDCDDFTKSDVNTDGFKFWFVDNDGDGFVADKEHYIYSCTDPIILLNNPLPLAAHYIGFTTEAELCNLIVDCNDNDNNEHPGQDWYLDHDGDGYPLNNTPEVTNQCLRPLGGYKTKSELKSLLADCDDTDPNVYPLTWYRDKDGDGYTDGTTLIQCGSQPVGYILSPQMFLGQPMIDCDDNNADILANQNWITDPDNDGYVSVGATLVKQCSKPAGSWISLSKLLETGAAFFTDPTHVDFVYDCNANDALEHPNQSWYPDIDGDGYPGSAVPVVQCSRPTGYKVASELFSLTDVDCNDNEPLEHPGQVWYVDFDNDGYSTLSTLTQCTRPLFYKAPSELKTTLFSDCNDRDATLNPDTKWYFDKDNDGYYGSFVSGCNSPGTGYTTTTKGADCDDNDATINPETEWYQDADNDGYYTSLQIGARVQCTSPGQGWRNAGLLGGGDCDDGNASINPATEWYLDADNDGYYSSLQIGAKVQCTRPGPGWRNTGILGGGDCDDGDASINPATIWYLDADNDGYSNPLYIGLPSCTPPLDGKHYITSTKGEDCNDGDATYNPETVWVIDKDGDGYYSGDPIIGCLSFGGPAGVTRKTTQLPGDCDDNDPTVHAGPTWYKDFDGDGYSDGTTTIQCTQPLGYKLANALTATSGDCDDNDASVNAGATWLYDGDNDGYYSGEFIGLASCTSPGPGWKPASTFTHGVDCDDNDASITVGRVWYKDADNDGYSDGTTKTQCDQPTGYKLAADLTATSGDCDDADPTVKDCMTDSDHDGVSDANDCAPQDPTKWRFAQAYLDADGDGYAENTNPTFYCYGTSLPAGYVLTSKGKDNCPGVYNPDQKDTDGDGVGDVCDTDDDNDGVLDVDDCAPLDATKWRTGNFYVDADGDGYGAGNLVSICYGALVPAGYSTNNSDCNDADPAVHDNCVIDSDHDGVPDANDCDPQDPTKWRFAQVYLDADGDGYAENTNPTFYCYGTSLPAGYVLTSKGKDNCPAVYNPDQKDTDGDGVGDACDTDDDNDGVLDVNDCAPLDATKWRTGNFYVDADGDGYGAGNLVSICYGALTPAGYSTNNSDCNDNDKTIYPGAPELCDGKDNNCNGQTDEGGGTTWYRDADGDGYGNPAISKTACTKPAGYVSDNTDCNDNDIKVHSPQTYYLDSDKDGYGNPAKTKSVCSSTPPAGYVKDNTDCNDNNVLIHTPVKYYVDNDHDGYGSQTIVMLCTLPSSGYSLVSGDCNDNNPAIHPLAQEICGNGIDDNCNGQIDEGCAACGNATGLTATNISSSSARLNWTASVNPSQWQVDYKKSGALTWKSILLSGSARSTTVSFLSSNQTYNWRIKALCGKTWTSYSATQSFKTLSLQTSAEKSVTPEESEEKSPAIKLYPNPTQGQFVIELNVAEKLDGNAKIQLIDMTGRTVQTDNAPINGGALQKTINVSPALTKGMYMVRIVVNDNVYHTRMIYQK